MGWRQERADGRPPNPYAPPVSLFPGGFLARAGSIDLVEVGADVIGLGDDHVVVRVDEDGDKGLPRYGDDALTLASIARDGPREPVEPQIRELAADLGALRARF